MSATYIKLNIIMDALILGYAFPTIKSLKRYKPYC